MTRIVIIGGGPAGYEAALVAAQLGAQVTVIERDGIGGASVLTDCVPSKTLIAAAGAMTSVRDSAVLGLQGAELATVEPRPRVGQPPGQGPGDGPVRRHPRPAERARACASSAGRARLSDEIRGLAAHRVEVLDAEGEVTEELESDVVLIATGADPRVLRRRRARRRADPRLARRLRARGDARAPRRHRLRRHRGRVRLRLPRGRRAGHAGLLPRPGAARRGRRRGRRRRAGLPVPRRADRRARPRRRGEAHREGRGRRAHRRPHRRGLARPDDRRHRAEHLRAEPRAVRGRGRPRPATSSSTGSPARPCRASTPPATSPASSSSPRSRRCRAASRCGTPSARPSRRSSSRPSPPTSSPTPRSPPSGCRRSRSPRTQDIDVVRLPLATNARAKMSDLHDGFVKLFTRRSTGVVVGGVVVAPGASELILPDRAGRDQGPDRRRPGADVLDLPVAVGLDHRGRPTADGRRRALLTGAAGGPAPPATDVTDFSAQLRGSGADARVAPPMQRWMPSVRFALAPRRLLRSLAVGSAVAAAVLAPGAVAHADEPTGETVVGRARAGVAGDAGRRARGRRADQLGADRRPATPSASRPRTSRASPPAPPSRSRSTLRTAGTPRTRCTRSSPPPRSSPRPRSTRCCAAPPASPTRSPSSASRPTASRPGRRHRPAARRHSSTARSRTSGPSRATARSRSASPPAATGSHPSPAAPTRRRMWNEVAATVGFVPGPGRHLMLYVSSAATNCSYALAQVGSSPATGGMLYVRDTVTSVIAHELGHNFGLGHSSARQCDAAVESGSCRTARLPRLLRRHGRLLGPARLAQRRPGRRGSASCPPPSSSRSPSRAARSA